MPRVAARRRFLQRFGSSGIRENLRIRMAQAVGSQCREGSLDQSQHRFSEEEDRRFFFGEDA